MNTMKIDLSIDQETVTALSQACIEVSNAHDARCAANDRYDKACATVQLIQAKITAEVCDRLTEFKIPTTNFPSNWDKLFSMQGCDPK